MNDILICIPARYASSRLPGKPLLKINNKSIIEHVYLNALKIDCIDKNNIIILTDDNKIYKEVNNFGGNCYISKKYCENGTARIIDYLVENNIQKKYILNIQGDEPFFDILKIQELIHRFIELKKSQQFLKCGTLYYDSNDFNYINSKNKVKLVLNENKYIMYGSRQNIPGSKKENNSINYHIHIGIFIFDYNYLLNEYIKKNGIYQDIEDLEWLKILEQDYKILALKTNIHEVGVDTQEDYEYLKNKYEIK